MMKYTYTSVVAAAALLLTPALLNAQNPPAAPATPPAAPAAPKKKESDLKWSANLVWVSFIVEQGAGTTDYFGAMEKKDYDAILAGSAKGFIPVQQVFYYNPSTRGFMRFDAAVPVAANMKIYKKNGYFRSDTFVRVVPLSKEFVTFLAVQEFLMVEGAPEE